MTYLTHIFTFITTSLSILSGSDVGMVFLGAGVLMAVILVFNRLLHL